MLFYPPGRRNYAMAKPLLLFPKTVAHVPADSDRLSGSAGVPNTPLIFFWSWKLAA